MTATIFIKGLPPISLTHLPRLIKRQTLFPVFSFRQTQEMASQDVLNYSTVLHSKYGEPYHFSKGPLPEPNDGEAVIRIDFTGVCHGDVYSRDGGGPAPAEPIRPLIGGHEGIGEIVSLGKDFQNQAFTIGDLVGIAWRQWVCKDCEACRLGAENYCEMQKITGINEDGTFQRSFYLAQVSKPIIYSSPQVTFLSPWTRSPEFLHRLIEQRLVQSFVRESLPTRP